MVPQGRKLQETLKGLMVNIKGSRTKRGQNSTTLHERKMTQVLFGDRIFDFKWHAHSHGRGEYINKGEEEKWEN